MTAQPDQPATDRSAIDADLVIVPEDAASRPDDAAGPARQAALSPAGGNSADTEQLRETLRSYRILCQNLADVGSQLQQSRP